MYNFLLGQTFFILNQAALADTPDALCYNLLLILGWGENNFSSLPQLNVRKV